VFADVLSAHSELHTKVTAQVSAKLLIQPGLSGAQLVVEVRGLGVQAEGWSKSGQGEQERGGVRAAGESDEQACAAGHPTLCKTGREEPFKRGGATSG
jgi:hypothetical protein